MRGAIAVSVALLCTGCSASDAGESAEPRAVPLSQSAAARELRLPRMRAAQVTAVQAGTPITTLRVQVAFDGAFPPDTTVQARSFDAACIDSFVDTAVVRTGNAIVGALVWVEGAGAVTGTPDTAAEYRPTVVVEQCRLLPRLQIAAPGSTIQLVTHDARVESLVVVPSSPSTPIDTIAFNTDGQLVPVRHVTDSTGVIGIYSTRLPWARAFVVTAHPGAAALTDASGAATFTLDKAVTKVTVRAWHPSLGVATGSVNPSTAGAAPTLTLTFRR